MLGEARELVINVRCSPLFHWAAFALDFHLLHLQACLLPQLVCCDGDDDEVDAIGNR